MDHLKIRQEIREDFAKTLVDRSGSETSSDGQKDRFIRGEAAESPALFRISVEQLFPDGCACEDSFLSRKGRYRFREVAAYLGSGRDAEPVGQARRHVGFVDDAGDMKSSGCTDDGNCHKTSFGEDNIRFQFFQNGYRFVESLLDTERIRKVFKVKIPAEFAGRNPIVRDPQFGDELFFDPVIGSDIGDFVPFVPQLRDQGNIRGDMSGGSSAGQNDLFHITSLDNSLFLRKV